MIDISSFGSSFMIIGSLSFPFGFEVTAFPDDEDPLEASPIEVVKYYKLYDGTTFKYKVTAPIELTVRVIAGSDDDKNLQIMLTGNRSTAYNASSPEDVSMVFNPPGSVLSMAALSEGTILSGPPINSIKREGRFGSNAYRFEFDALITLASVEAAALNLAGAGLSGVVQGLGLPSSVTGFLGGI